MGPFCSNCVHKRKFEKVYEYQDLTVHDVKTFFNLLYFKPGRQLQADFLTRHMVITKVKRWRVKDVDAKRSSSAFKVRYYVTTKKKRKFQFVHQRFFIL